MLMPEMKAHRIGICQELLMHYENEGEELLYAVMIGDKK
jgi:hypothetical protein